MAASEAEVRRAQAQLDLLAAGARPEAIAAAEAEVAAAQATVEQAKVALAETELKAPFAGTVAALDARAGEQVGARQPRRTTGGPRHLTDRDRQSDGAERRARPRRAPQRPSPSTPSPASRPTGKVVRIKPLGENKQGDMTYTVVVQPDELDARLRWNMTASVAIEPE